MQVFNTSTSYGSIAKVFHWTISVLVIVMLSVGFFLGDVPKDYQGLAYNLHKLTGILILFLVLLRLLWAIVNVKPRLPQGTPGWQRVAEQIVHFSLYFFVVLMPLAGWIGSIAGGHPPHLGDFNFELPIAESKPVAGLAFDIHGWAAWVLIALVSVHVLAALYHHFVRRDAILLRMLPGA